MARAFIASKSDSASPIPPAETRFSACASRRNDAKLSSPSPPPNAPRAASKPADFNISDKNVASNFCAAAINFASEVKGSVRTCGGTAAGIAGIGVMGTSRSMFFTLSLRAVKNFVTFLRLEEEIRTESLVMQLPIVLSAGTAAAAPASAALDGRKAIADGVAITFADTFVRLLQSTQILSSDPGAAIVDVDSGDTILDEATVEVDPENPEMSDSDVSKASVSDIAPTDSHGELLPDLPAGTLAIMPLSIQAPLTVAQGTKRDIEGLALRVDAQGSRSIIDSIATNQSPDEEQTFGLGLRRSDLSLSGNGSVPTPENTRQVPDTKRNFGNYGTVSLPQQQGGLGEVSQTALETAKLVQAVTDKNAPTLQIQTSPSPDTAIPARVLSTFALSGTRLPPIAGGQTVLKDSDAVDAPIGTGEKIVKVMAETDFRPTGPLPHEKNPEQADIVNLPNKRGQATDFTPEFTSKTERSHPDLLASVVAPPLGTREDTVNNAGLGIPAPAGASSLSAAGFPDQPTQRPHTPLLAQHVAHQVAVSVQQTSDRVTEMALDPVELGKVRMTIKATDQSIVLTVVADRPETADLMRRHVDVLQQEFRALGYTSVTLNFSAGQDQAGFGLTGGAADRSGSEGGEADNPSTIDAADAVPAETIREADGSLDLRL